MTAARRHWYRRARQRTGHGHQKNAAGQRYGVKAPVGNSTSREGSGRVGLAAGGRVAACVASLCSLPRARRQLAYIPWGRPVFAREGLGVIKCLWIGGAFEFGRSSASSRRAPTEPSLTSYLMPRSSRAYGASCAPDTCHSSVMPPSRCPWSSYLLRALARPSRRPHSSNRCRR